RNVLFTVLFRACGRVPGILKRHSPTASARAFRTPVRTNGDSRRVYRHSEIVTSRRSGDSSYIKNPYRGALLHRMTSPRNRLRSELPGPETCLPCRCGLWAAPASNLRLEHYRE